MNRRCLRALGLSGAHAAAVADRDDPGLLPVRPDLGGAAASAAGQSGADVDVPGRPAGARHRHAIRHLFRRRAVHPFPARTGDGGAGDPAVPEPPSGAAVDPADGLRAAGGVADGAGVGGGDRAAAGGIAGDRHLDRAEIGDRGGGDGHFRPAGRRSGADGGAGDPDRHPGRDRGHAADEPAGDHATSAPGALPPGSPRMASAPRGRFRSIRWPAPSPASPWA